MTLIGLIIALVAIFVGQGKGLAIYGGATLLACLAWGFPPLGDPIQGPIVVVSILVTVVAIMISRWWGLAFWFFGSIIFLILAAL
jgi:hypothetical protein